MRRANRTHFIVAGLLALAWLLPAKPGYCWDKYTHMVIAQIAYDQLNPTAKAKVDQLAALVNEDPFTAELDAGDKPYDAISIAAWPDDIRSLRDETRSFGPWHYIDLDPHISSNDADAVAAVKAYQAPNGESNVYDAIVTKCLPTLKDPNAKPADQARMLAFLEHFVGDIHMPLHCYGPLAGGNGYKLNPVIPYASYGVTNLHAFWDDAIRFDAEDGEIVANQAPDTPRPLKLESLASSIEAQWLTKDKKLLKQTDPAMWAVESDRLTMTAVFPPAGGDGVPKFTGDTPPDQPLTLSMDYIHASRAIALQRVALAGYRLANMLNTLYPDSK